MTPALPDTADASLPVPAPAPPARSPAATADLVLLGITALWGFTFVTVKDALRDADPFTFLALRFAVGALVAGLVARRALVSRSAWRAGALLGLFLFTGFSLQTFGLELTTPSRSAFLTGLTVILVPFVSTGLSRRLPPVSALAGAALAALGLWRLTGVTLDGPWPLGDVLTLGGTVAYAFHIAVTERVAGRDAPTALVAVQLGVTAVLCAASIPFAPHHFTSTPGLWSAVLLTGVFASALAISAQTWGQARTTAVRAALIFSLEPVFASAWSAFLGRERIGAAEFVGGGLILLGIVVSEVGAAWGRARHAP